ncbi:hypothetical protein [Qipengyuania sp. JC766]|uniref:hypothetical protein n=1 Tax=Qipengyuania sp. JC766 TaxID=3232139 RepID=UPI00345916A5
MTNPDDLARTRFFLMSMMRLGGAVLALIGAVLVSGRIVDAPILGYGLIVIGMVEFFFLPKLMAKRWRSPPE